MLSIWSIRSLCLFNSSDALVAIGTDVIKPVDDVLVRNWLVVELLNAWLQSWDHFNDLREFRDLLNLSYLFIMIWTSAVSSSHPHFMLNNIRQLPLYLTFFFLYFFHLVPFCMLELIWIRPCLINHLPNSLSIRCSAKWTFSLFLKPFDNALFMEQMLQHFLFHFLLVRI